jgi:hypothetical protein
MVKIRNYLLVILSISVIGCDNNDMFISSNPSKIGCLTEINIDKVSGTCEMNLVNSNCELVDIGTKELSENIKSKFVDFCNDLNSELTFYDSIGNTINARISEKEFKSGNYNVSLNFNSPNCENYCLNNEEASIIISSSKFTIEVVLYTGINFNTSTENLNELIETGYAIWAIKGNSKQVIFQLPIEDHLNQEIIPDTSYIRFHEEIELNNTNFNDIYSNENNFANGLVRKERVYFNKEIGLVGIRDSVGILWTKE